VPCAVPSATPSRAHRRSMNATQACCHATGDDDAVVVSSGSHCSSSTTRKIGRSAPAPASAKLPRLSIGCAAA
jgi:hypothetical protein